ncbi:hypothetical protein QJS66_19355 [Kocuria rhizophila]|nr:hypothetical protein QJS66_19355 [Kocuria rhizophila]
MAILAARLYLAGPDTCAAPAHHGRWHARPHSWPVWRRWSTSPAERWPSTPLILFSVHTAAPPAAELPGAAAADRRSAVAAWPRPWFRLARRQHRVVPARRRMAHLPGRGPASQTRPRPDPDAGRAGRLPLHPRLRRGPAHPRRPG